jgi:hypothetical protein
MRILIEQIQGDASFTFYNKQCEVIHVEQVSGKTSNDYIRSVPVSEAEYGSCKALFSGKLLSYKVIA